jgi:Ala-tRNA(Pro) deacylase
MRSIGDDRRKDAVMTSDAAPSGLEGVTGFLDDQGVGYEVREHRAAETAVEEARAAGLPAGEVAKTIALRDGGRYRLAVIPASHRLDLAKARKSLGAGRSLRLATEREMQSDFPQFEVGALPPLGPILGAPEVLDGRLLEHEQILCNAGDHRHGLLLDPHELVEIVQPKVADICEE